MNVLSALAHTFQPMPVPLDAATIERRRLYAEALDAARNAPPEDIDPEADAFDAQCRRVRESHYVNQPADVFHVC
ncbi:hypothetical protein [Cognatilysobacter terrigena]|uniref:hypothetical protein n=1 Tax=Cognatilysobacter terrigena TaxID=2488749 RepID=UPI001061FDCD|nr:hypothetical protein [Lysobacter terrigena]